MLVELMGMWFISVQLFAQVQMQGALNSHFESLTWTLPQSKMPQNAFHFYTC